MSKSKKSEPDPEPEPEPEPAPVETGSGEFVFSNGARYVGSWKSKSGEEGKRRDGDGTYTNGPEEYTGMWVDDRMEGQGKYTFSSGAVYVGEFKDNMFEGTGVYRFPDGASYSGAWHRNKMHGEGGYTDAEKVTTVGSFFNGMYNTGKSYVSLRPVKEFK